MQGKVPWNQSVRKWKGCENQHAPWTIARSVTWNHPPIKSSHAFFTHRWKWLCQEDLKTHPTSAFLNPFSVQNFSTPSSLGPTRRIRKKTGTKLLMFIGPTEYLIGPTRYIYWSAQVFLLKQPGIFIEHKYASFFIEPSRYFHWTVQVHKSFASLCQVSGCLLYSRALQVFLI